MQSAQYQLLPSLSDEEFAALKADIALRGIQVPVELDESGTILDGHHRVQIAEELGITYPTMIRHGLNHQEKVHHVLSLNLHRRHLTREQRIVLEKRLRDEGLTYREIAEAVKVSDETVRLDLSTSKNLEVEPLPFTPDTDDDDDGDAGEMGGAPDLFARPAPADPPRIIGKDGKARPAVYQPRKPTFGQTREEAVKRSNDSIILASISQEWYTPSRYIEAAREVLGGFDVDPASSELANRTVRASRFYTEADNGLAYEWPGRVWMNPPYGQMVGAFVRRLVQQFADDIVTEAITLVNAHATDTEWFRPLWDHTLCFTDHRINFEAPDGKGTGSTHGSVFVYLGPNPLRFKEVFQQFGPVVVRL